jgi:hypothetical protein
MSHLNFSVKYNAQIAYFFEHLSNVINTFKLLKLFTTLGFPESKCVDHKKSAAP